VTAVAPVATRRGVEVSYANDTHRSVSWNGCATPGPDPAMGSCIGRAAARHHFRAPMDSLKERQRSMISLATRRCVCNRKAERRTHDYVRHGTTTRPSPWRSRPGQVTGFCKPRNQHQSSGVPCATWRSASAASTSSHPPGHVRVGPGAHDQDPYLHQQLGRPQPTLRVDQDRRPNPPESEPSRKIFSCDPLDRPGAIVTRYQ
jgi:hypothetical protein